MGMTATETSAPAYPTPEGIDPRPWTVMECVVTAESTETVGDYSVRRTARLDGYATREVLEAFLHMAKGVLS